MHHSFYLFFKSIHTKDFSGLKIKNMAFWIDALNDFLLYEVNFYLKIS
jgi:hypothetical protein